MDQRLTVVTLGVRDLTSAVAFYSRLGWTPANDVQAQDVAFFQCGGVVFALWHRDELAADSCVSDPGGWGGVTIAHNVGSPDEVDEVLTRAQAAGATLGRAGAPTAWGGYSGIFIDPDGHPWEIAHNPHWTLAADGSVTI